MECPKNAQDEKITQRSLSLDDLRRLVLLEELQLIRLQKDRIDRKCKCIMIYEC